jgi:BirA family transcriptional regulator, biotin operon repressor / biotin---[acetyl-CoA-carboxylase] ligase
VSVLGYPRVHLRLTDSTNERARELALAGAPHGTLVTAAEQTHGRGRQGRAWSAPPGSSLLMSLLLRQAPSSRASASPGQASREPAAPWTATAERSPNSLPLIAAVAVCDALAAGEALAAQAQVKWPNDIVVQRGDRSLGKLAGILVEGRPQEGWAVLGIGVNVAVKLSELPAQLQGSAATLGQTPAAIEPLLERVLGALERRLAEPLETVLEAWRSLDALRGREVSFNGGQGRAEGIDDTGRLNVRAGDGTLAAIDAGEVEVEPTRG